jgi:hypothetical protein
VTHLEELKGLLTALGSQKQLSVPIVEAVCGVKLEIDAASNKYFTFYKATRPGKGIRIVRFSEPSPLAKEPTFQVELRASDDVEVTRADFETACGKATQIGANPHIPPEGVDSFDHPLGRLVFTSKTHRLYQAVIQRKS